MIGVWRARWVGFWSALTSPIWIDQKGLHALLRWPSSVDGAGHHATAAVRAAAAVLARLSRLPLSPWRNTCLYRSIAICLSLRSCGVRARLRLGVRSPESGEENGVFAHAWVDCDGTDVNDILPECVGQEPGYVGFRIPAKSPP